MTKVKEKKRSKRRRGSEPRFEAKHGAALCRRKKLCAECGKKLRGRRTRWCSDACISAYLIRSDPGEARRQVGIRDKGVCAFCSLDTVELQAKVKAATQAAYDDWWEAEGRPQAEARPGRLGVAKKGQPFVVANYKTRGESTTKSQGPYLERARRAFLAPYGMAQWWWRKSFWDCDHVLEVSQGGGECGLQNLRTLCISCHTERSGHRTTVRAKKKRTRAKRIPRRAAEACGRRDGCRGRVDPCRGCRRYRARVLGAQGG